MQRLKSLHRWTFASAVLHFESLPSSRRIPQRRLTSFASRLSMMTFGLWRNGKGVEDAMGFESWIRGRARLAVDGLFCSSSSDVRRVGDTDSGWVMHTNPPPKVCYCAGVGKGMSFEQELAKLTTHPVLVFDPSP